MAARTRTDGVNIWSYIIGLYPVFTLLWGVLEVSAIAVAVLTPYDTALMPIAILLGFGLLVIGFLHLLVPAVIVATIIDVYQLRDNELWNVDWWFLFLLMPHLLFAIWPVLRAKRTDLGEIAYFGKPEWAVLVVSAMVTLWYLYRRYQHVGVPLFGSQSTTR